MPDALYDRLNTLAQDVYWSNEPLAEKLAEMANELEADYVLADSEGDVPTNAQGIALARFLRPGFRGDRRDRYASVSRSGAGLGEDYLFIRLADGYEGGIDRDGRTST